MSRGVIWSVERVAYDFLVLRMIWSPSIKPYPKYRHVDRFSKCLETDTRGSENDSLGWQLLLVIRNDLSPLLPHVSFQLFLFLLQLSIPDSGQRSVVVSYFFLCTPPAGWRQPTRRERRRERGIGVRRTFFNFSTTSPLIISSSTIGFPSSIERFDICSGV